MRLIHEGQALHAGLFRSTLACVETEEAEVKMNGPWVKLLDILTHTHRGPNGAHAHACQAWHTYPR